MVWYFFWNFPSWVVNSSLFLLRYMKRAVTSKVCLRLMLLKPTYLNFWILWKRSIKTQNLPGQHRKERNSQLPLPGSSLFSLLYSLSASICLCIPKHRQLTKYHATPRTALIRMCQKTLLNSFWMMTRKLRLPSGFWFIPANENEKYFKIKSHHKVKNEPSP